ncbi:hypothetical protein SDC9_157909 [bioreactor metagenome]|uniref:Nitroreductase domain-containing protein n=1 Tax=bioreactor metagenome TaxID=1076179 RepID=A0A645FDN9_9ZZZZ
MDFMSLVRQRESCRNFSEKIPTHQELENLIEAARLSPSACNSQPWSFVVVTGVKAKEVAKCTQSLSMNKFTENCPSFILVCEEKATLMAKLGGVVKDQQYAPIDIGLATAHICYQATAQGMGTCILGWFDEKKVIETLSLPKNKRIRLIIAAGFAKDDHLRQKKRKNLEEIVTYISD